MYFDYVMAVSVYNRKKQFVAPFAEGLVKHLTGFEVSILSPNFFIIQRLMFQICIKIYKSDIGPSLHNFLMKKH